MKGDYSTNEGYRKIVKKKAAVMLALMCLGLITIIVVEVCKRCFGINVSDFTDGTYKGFGTGLMVAGGLLYLKRISMLKNEEKLKKARIEESDERLRAITDAAWKAATIVLLLVMYVEFLIAGIGMPEIIRIIEPLIAVFFIAYLIAYRVISKRM
jgi:hypothetical protein